MVKAKPDDAAVALVPRSTAVAAQDRVERVDRLLPQIGPISVRTDSEGELELERTIGKLFGVDELVSNFVLPRDSLRGACGPH